MKKITIDPVTRIEGHAKIDIYLDDAGPRRRHAFPRHPGARIREIHRRPAVLRDAVHHRAHLRHLPGEPPAGVRQGLRRHHGGDAAGGRRQAARAGPLRAVRAVARAQLLPPLGARPAAGLRFRSRRAATFSASSKSIPSWPRAGVALRKFGQQIIEGLAKERVHPSWIVPGGVNAPLAPRGARPHPGRTCPTRAPWPNSTLAFFKSVLDQFTEEIANFGTAPTMYAGLGGRGRRPAMVRRPPEVQGRRGRHRGRRTSRARDYAQLHRRSVAARFLPESALLQAARLSRRASTAWDRWRG